MQPKPSRVLFWVFLAICAFALGFLGMELVKLQRDTSVRSQPAPALPT